MASFSASDAALAGFVFVRRQPRAVLVWAIVSLVVSTGFAALTRNQIAPVLAQLSTMTPATLNDPAKIQAFNRQLLPFDIDALLFSVIFYPIVYAAMNRAILRPKEGAFGYFRVGGDELRQMGLMLSFFVLAIGAEFVVIIATTFLALLVGLATHAASNSDGLTVLSALAVCLAAAAGCIVVGVRLSLASAQTFATRKINIFGSWALTKGKFWPMFGAYVLSIFLALIVMLLGYVIIVAVGAVTGGTGDLVNSVGPGKTPLPQTVSLGSMFSAPRIIQMVLGAALTALTWPVMMMPAPTIYREIVADAAGHADIS